MTKTTSSAPPADRFETYICGRCGGSGRWGYGVCYGCSGSGTKYTRRGGAAARFYQEMSQMSIVDLQPGDRYYDSGPLGSGWITVQRVVPRSQDDYSGGSIYRLYSDCERIARQMGMKFSTMRETSPDPETGEARVLVQSGYNVIGTNKRGETTRMVGFGPDHKVTVAGVASKTTRMKAALRYQSMLNKQGNLLPQYR